MRRLFLVMHKPLASAHAKCVEHILGGSPEVLVMDIEPDSDPGQAAGRLCACLSAAPDVPAIVLCDLYGATPYNIAQDAVARARGQGVHVGLVAGANLSMILKALRDPIPDLDLLCESVSKGAIRGIVNRGTGGG